MLTFTKITDLHRGDLLALKAERGAGNTMVQVRNLHYSISAIKHQDHRLETCISFALPLYVAVNSAPGDRNSFGSPVRHWMNIQADIALAFLISQDHLTKYD
jgi:hypothetical protein